jgi:hypothetical protein
MKTNAGPTIVVGTRTRVPSAFLPPPLKFRTAGFPQYGFKREVRMTTFAALWGDLYVALAPALAPYGPEGHAYYWAGAVLRSALVHRPLARQQVLLSCQVFAYYGLIRASRLLPPIYALDGGSLPFPEVQAGNERFPNLLCLSVFSVPPSLPRQAERLLSAIPSSLTVAFPRSRGGRRLRRHAIRSRHGPHSRGCKVRLMLRPGELLALHRSGRLRSSFHLRSRLPEASNITTRVNSQLPRPDFHRQDKQHYGLRRGLEQFG